MKRSSRKSKLFQVPRPRRVANATRPHSALEELESRMLLSSGMHAKLTSAGNMDMWGPTYTFKVTYTSDKRIRPSSIDNSDILITGPNGYSRLARFVGMVDNLRTIVARYKVSTPRNVWDPSANGVYTFKMMGNQVKDLGERYVAAGILGSFQARLPSFPTTVGQRDSIRATARPTCRTSARFPMTASTTPTRSRRRSTRFPKGTACRRAARPARRRDLPAQGHLHDHAPIYIYSSVILRGEGATLRSCTARAATRAIRSCTSTARSRTDTWCAPALRT